MRSARLVALAATSAALLIPSVASAACPTGATCEDAYFPSGDGTTLHADVIKPTGKTANLPVILSIGPYFAHAGQTGAAGAPDYDPTATGPNERFKDMYTEGKIFERGYALVQVDLRGFGASAGCNDFGGPGEQADAKAAVEWAASQPWSNGRVGMWGKSYDGWTQVMALDEKPKGLAATVIQSPIIDGYRTLYQNGVHYDSGWYGTPALYQSIDATGISIMENPQYILNSALGTNPACYALNIAQQNATVDWDSPFWDERNLPGARGSSVPTLWSHGFLDANTKPDNFLPVWETLKGPHRAWFGQYTHVRPQDKTADGKRRLVGREGFIDEAMRWMDRYVKGAAAAEAPVENDPVVEVEDGATMKYRAEAAWPPADAELHTLAVRGGTTTNQPSGNSVESAAGAVGIWSVSKALPYAVHMAGTPRFKFAAGTPSNTRANVHALLYDISEKGAAKLVTRGAMAVTAGGPKSFELYPQDWTFAAGHKIGFLIAPSDEDWYLAPNQAGSLSINNAGVQLPTLRYLRDAFLPSYPTTDERARPAPFDVTARIAGADVNFDLPAKLVTPPVVTLPGTPAKQKLTVSLRARGRTLIASGKAATGMKLVVRLVKGKRTVKTARVTAKAGTWKATFRRVGKGRFRAIVSATSAGTRIRVQSALRRVR